MKEIGIVITNFNRANLLLRCINSIKKFIPDTISYKIYVIDDASTDESVEIVQYYHPDVKIYKNLKNEGYVKSLNRGIRMSQEEYILVLDSDTEFVEDIITPMMNFLKCPDVIMVGISQIKENGFPQGSYGEFPNPVFFVIGQKLSSYFLKAKSLFFNKIINKNKPFPVKVVYSSCVMLKRKIFNKVGLFDERFRYLEADVEFCYRVKKKFGGGIYMLPYLKIIHQGIGSTRIHERVIEYHRSQMLFFLKYHPSWKNILKWGIFLRHILEIVILFLGYIFKKYDFSKLKTRFFLLKKYGQIMCNS
ncbi:MAG: glycosyltransferase family 2 protein [Candidatus Omnitrophica bacterium]|nr:glycosyltransferase family 2 protein [Candidatus Omnitrophota bacterium]